MLVFFDRLLVPEENIRAALPAAHQAYKTEALPCSSSLGFSCTWMPQSCILVSLLPFSRSFPQKEPLYILFIATVPLRAHPFLLYLQPLCT